MSDLQMWNMIIGFVSATFLLPIIQQPKWSPQKRSLVTIGFSTIAGLVTAYLNGAFDAVGDLRTAVTSVLFTLIATIGFYHGFAKHKIAPAIEAATSPPAD